VLARLPSLALTVAALAAAVPITAAAHTRSTSPSAQYQQALRALAGTPGFRMVESIDTWTSPRRSEQAELRYRAPDRLQTTVTSLRPPPIAQLTSIQVGRERCQTPPGICFRSPTPVSPFTAVHQLLGPLLPVNYHSASYAGGHLIIRMDKATGKGSHYYARLTVDAQTGLPITFTSQVELNGKKLVSQHASFSYGTPYTIRLPPAAKHKG
jgi:hypothetical protein